MQRFFDKVNKTSTCWLWTASCRKNGYGAFKMNGKTHSAHRLSWQIHFGDIPTNMFVCHKCDNPLCVNPSHLFLGTAADNMQDAFAKKRIRLPANSRKFQPAHRPANAGITKQQALEIKTKIIARTGSLKQLAIELGLPLSLIKDISSGRIYK